jgi:uncharacterized membrane protein
VADRFATRLATEIQGWVREGLVSAEQGARIAARYPPAAEWLSRPAALFGLIGGGLVAAGLALVIAHNWQSLHRWVKLGALVGLMLVAHWGGLRVRERGYHWLGEGLAVIGGALLFLGIALMGQVYNLSERPADALLLWWVLLLPAAYALPSFGLGALAYAGVVAWFSLLLADHATALGGAVYRTPVFWMVALGALGLTLLGLGMLHGDGAHRRLRQLLEQAGIALSLSVFIVLGMGYYEELHEPCRCASAPIGLVTLVAVIALAAGAQRLPEAPPGARGACLALLLLLPLGLAAVQGLVSRAAPAYAWDAFRYASWVLSFGVSLGLVLFGARWGRTSWINWGVVSLLAQGLVRYIDLFGTMLQTSALFFSSGALMLGLGWALERMRRRMTAEARRVDAPA